jgi:hypothetical protein
LFNKQIYSAIAVFPVAEETVNPPKGKARKSKNENKDSLFQNPLVVVQQRNAIFVDCSHKACSKRERRRIKKLPRRT